MRSWSPCLALLALVLMGRVADADITITQGGDWTIASRVAVTACVLGHCASAKGSAQETAFLPAGTVVQIALQVWDCGYVPLDDYCSPVPGRAGKIQLRRCDKLELATILRECSPYPGLRLRRIGGFEKVADDGLSFQWRSTFGFTVRVQGHTVTVAVNVRANGERVGDGLVDVAAAALHPAPAVDALVARAVDAALRR